MNTITLHTKETVLLDDDMAQWATHHRWLSCLSMTTAGISLVAIAKVDGELVYLHEHVLGVRRGKGVVHGPPIIFKDGNTLNMQRANMYVREE